MATDTPPLRIGTRGSPLALAQTDLVIEALRAKHPHLAGDGAIETVAIKTTGDRITDRPLLEVGGKGLFTKEIDEALMDGRIDLAVNSMKDLPTVLPEGIVVGAVLERADPRDAFISHKADSIPDLPKGAVVGTASLRRQAQILAARPDLNVVTLRGNVETRLRKLKSGEMDATILAMAGLARLGKEDVVTAPVDPGIMLPAVGQGAICVTCLSDKSDIVVIVDDLNHTDTARTVSVERAFLAELDGSCRTPLAALAEMDGKDKVRLRAQIAWPDGHAVYSADETVPADKASDAGRAIARRLLDEAGPDFMTSLKEIIEGEAQR